MSILIELGEFLCGALSGYAVKNRWSKCKTFIVISCLVFSLAMVYVSLTPSSKSLWVAIIIAGIGSLATGLFTAFLMWLIEWRRTAKPQSLE